MSPEKYHVDFNIPLLKFRLQISVVVVLIEGHDVVFAVDRYSVYRKPLHALNADLDQVSAPDVFRQSINKSFFTNYREAFTRNRENAVEMEDVLPQRDPYNIIGTSQNIFKPSVACFV